MIRTIGTAIAASIALIVVAWICLAPRVQSPPVHVIGGALP